jgi:hypothetical protein
MVSGALGLSEDRHGGRPEKTAECPSHGSQDRQRFNLAIRSPCSAHRQGWPFPSSVFCMPCTTWVAPSAVASIGKFDCVKT